MCQKHSWCLALGQTCLRVLISVWSLSDKVNSGVIPWVFRADIQFTRMHSFVCGGASASVTTNRYERGSPSLSMSAMPLNNSILLLLVLTSNLLVLVMKAIQ